MEVLGIIAIGLLYFILDKSEKSRMIESKSERDYI